MKPELSIKVVGVGTAGLCLLDKLAAVGFPAAHFIALDSDIQELQRCQLTERIRLGETTRRGWGCSGDAAEGAECMRAASDRIADKLRGADLVILLAGTGGGIGGGGASPVAEIAGKEGALVISIALQPFNLEGRQDASQLATERLSQVSDALICISNQTVMDNMANQCSVQECMETSNIWVLESLMGLGRLVRSDGLLNVNFEDVRELIQGHHGTGFLAAVEMTGDFSSKILVDSLMKHPFFEPNIDFSNVSGMFVTMAGNDLLNLNRVNEFEKYLATAFPQAERVLGVYPDKTMASAIGVTLMVLGPTKININCGNDQTPIETNRLVNIGDHIPILDAKGIQQQLPLVSVSKGCFDKGDSNLHDGEDLDVPTFLRRNIILN